MSKDQIVTVVLRTFRPMACSEPLARSTPHICKSPVLAPASADCVSGQFTSSNWNCLVSVSKLVLPKSHPLHDCHVRYWPKADMLIALSDLRFRGKSGHRNLRASRPLLTHSGHGCSRIEPCRTLPTAAYRANNKMPALMYTTEQAIACPARGAA
jgi:hypothetical protein